MVEAVSRRNAGRWPSRWLAALALSGLAAACDLDVHDIAITEPSTKPPAQHAIDSGTPEAQSDAGTKEPHAISEPPFKIDAGVPLLEGDDSVDPGITRPRKPKRHNSGATDSSGGAAGGTPTQDARVADDNGVGTTDRDASTDDVDGGREANDPCRNGTFDCEVIPFTIVSDNGNTAFPSGGTVTVTVEGYSFTTQSQAGGHAELLLPVGRWTWLRVSADGYWTSEGPTYFFSGLGAPVNMYQSPEMKKFVPELEATEGFVFALFRDGDNARGSGNTPGAGLDIGRTSQPPRTNDMTGLAVPSPTLVAGGSNVLLIPDVELGPLTLVPISPPGHSCIVLTGGGLTFESKPMTILMIQVACSVATQ